AALQARSDSWATSGRQGAPSWDPIAGAGAASIQARLDSGGANSALARAAGHRLPLLIVIAIGVAVAWAANRRRIAAVRRRCFELTGLAVASSRAPPTAG